MLYRVSHRTTFSYSQPVAISRHLVHLGPRRCRNQRTESSTLLIEPAPTISEAAADYFGNPVTYLTIQEPHSRLVVQAVSTIEVTAPVVPEAATTPPWDSLPARLQADASLLDVVQFAFDSPFSIAGDEIVDFARASFVAGRPILDAALDLTSRIYRDFEYDNRATDISTPVDDVLLSRRGVCQDFAHLELAALRHLGLPARYVSGYLLTRPPEGQPKLVGADASHAWISLWCGDAGWIDLDPTNNLMPRDEHITLAWGRDYGDVSPIKGFIVGGGQHDVQVAVDVTPLTAVK